MIERINEVLIPKQRQVLLRMIRMMPYRDIADDLHISYQATAKHILNIYDRLVTNADVLRAILQIAKAPAIDERPLQRCRWCSNEAEDRFVYHVGECPERRGLICQQIAEKPD